MRELQARIGRRLWLAAFELEESRELHAAHGRYVRSAACCLGLAVLRFARHSA